MDSRIVLRGLFLLIAGIFPTTSWSLPDDSQLPRKEITPQEYVAELRAASAVLDGADLAAVDTMRASLPGEWIIRADSQTDESSMRVKTDWLASALAAKKISESASNEQVRKGRQHLSALIDAAEAFQSSPERADLSRAHAQVERILRDREFQGSHAPSWFDKLKARVLAWITHQLDKILDRMGISTSAGNAVAWTLVVLAALLLAFWAVRFVIASASARSEIDLRGAVPAGQDWRYWANEARAAAERCDYRSAIHAAYWTAVAQLEEKNLLPGDRSRTPRELLRLVKRGNEAYGPLADLTRRFETTWYGRYTASSADWDDVRKQLEILECLRSSTHATANS